MSFQTDISPKRIVGCPFILLVCTMIVPWVRKFGNASMPEILVRLCVRLYAAQQVNQCECEAVLLTSFDLREVASPTAFIKTKNKRKC